MTRPEVQRTDAEGRPPATASAAPLQLLGHADAELCVDGVCDVPAEPDPIAPIMQEWGDTR